MTGEIRVLSDETINKVAAGEVVERPAAALKELVENSIDAGASRIDIAIEGAGKKLIRVTDNGAGMSQDGILLALERHSTSKITDAADLDRVSSFGFRGEALPSIAAVSRMEVVSRPADSDEATRVEIVSGKISRVTPCGGPAGTRIEVRSLFRNVPARLKFLRTNTTESSHCIAAVTQLALANPAVAFSMESGRRRILQLTAADSAGERLKDIAGAEIFGSLLPFRHAGGDLVMEGFIARPGRGRSGTEYQSLFVNGRPVRDHIVARTIRETWRDYAVGGDPATYFLWIAIPPEEVDVNVHPTKREVRFRSVSPLASTLKTVLHQALQQRRPRVRPGAAAPPPAAGERAPAYDPTVAKPLQLPMDSAALHSPAPARAPSMLQLFATYLVLTDDEGLLLVDQHAAHERILYEKILGDFQRQQTQQLLHPAVVDLTASQAEVLEELLEVLARYGIAVEVFGPRSFRVTALPAGLSGNEAEAFILKLIDGLRKDGLPSDLPDWLRERAALAACHSSVRASQKMAPLQVQSLLRDLFACENPAVCPHGRPTYIRIDRSEVEKRFRRIP